MAKFLNRGYNFLYRQVSSPLIAESLNSKRYLAVLILNIVSALCFLPVFFIFRIISSKKLA